MRLRLGRLTIDFHKWKQPDCFNWTLQIDMENKK